MILRDANKLILLIWNFTATFCAVQDPYAEGRNMEPDTRTSTSAVRYHYFPPRMNRNSNQLLGPQPNMGRSVGYYWDGHQYRYFQNSLASDFGQDNDFNWGTAPLLKNNAGTGELDKTENSTITEHSKADNITSDDEKESETTTGKTTTSSPKSKTGKIENTSASSKASSHFTTTKSTKNATDSSTTTTEPSTTTSTAASTTTTDYPTTTTESTITTSATTTTTTTTPTTATTTSTTTTPTTTVTTTPATSPATVQSTATTTAATVIPIVPPRDANAGRCTPKNAPGIGKNGQCSSTADLSRNCATLQITTSSDCGDYPGKWCCYSGKTKQAGTGGFIKCSPDSLPSVGMNGRCTSTKNLDSHCVNLDIAASVKDCGDFDGKWCCYLSPDDQVPTDSCSTKGPYSAQVVFEEGDIKGSLRFEQTAAGSLTKVTGQINGLPANSVLGLVVHTIGDTTSGCRNVGDHYNPQHIPHGELTSMIRHAGDCGNLQSDGNGIATVSLSSDKLQLVGPWSVVGRSLVIHANRDDGGGGSDDSLLTGSVGSPIVCGIIGQRTL